MLRGIFVWTETDQQVLVLTTFRKQMAAAGIEVICPDTRQSLAEQIRREMAMHVWLNKECLLITDHYIGEEMEEVPVVGFCFREEELGALSEYTYVLMGIEEISAKYIRTIHRRLCGKPLTIAETDRLRIRESTPADVKAFRRFQEEDLSVQDIPLITEDSYDDMQAYQTYQYGFYGYGMWTIELKASGTVIGRAGLEDQQQDGEMWVELGYMLGKRYRGYGYATEACQAVLDYAGEVLDMKVVTALVRKSNKASIRVLQRLEFQLVGTTLRKGRIYLIYETEFL